MELTVGVGSNRFTMSRGSFVYKQTFQKKVRLQKASQEILPDGFLLCFREEKHGLSFRVSVRKAGELEILAHMLDIPTVRY